MKSVKSIFVTLVLIASSVFSIAQNSDEILNELSSKAKKYSTIHATFDFELENLKADVKEKQSGWIFMQGEKFHVQLDKYEIICDGITQYTIDTELNEGSADLLADLDDDADAMSPNKLFTIWETGFKNSMGTESTKDGVTYQVINLFPVNPSDESYHTIKLTINIDAMELYKIMVMGKSGETFMYTVNQFETNMELNPAKFKYDESKYPGIDMIENF